MPSLQTTTTTLLALCSFLTGISAQTISGIPSCAQSCVGDFGGCSTLDTDCICSNTELIDSLVCCVSTSCDVEGQETTLDFARGFCGSNADNLPQSAGCNGDASVTASPSTLGPSATATDLTLLTATETSAAAGDDTADAQETGDSGAVALGRAGAGAGVGGLAVAVLGVVVLV